MFPPERSTEKQWFESNLKRKKKCLHDQWLVKCLRSHLKFMNAIKQNYFLTSAHFRKAGNILKPKQMNVKISLLPAYKDAGFLLRWGSEVREHSCAGCGEKIPQMATGGTACSSYSHTVKNSPTMGQKMDRGGVAKWLLPILRFWLLVSLETLEISSPYKLTV